VLVGTVAADAVFVIARSGAGVTVKFDALEVAPEKFVMLMRPVVAPAGTVVVIVVLLTTVKVALTPLNFTSVVEKKFEPVIVTVCVIGPLVGVKLLITGGALGLMLVVSVLLLLLLVGSG